MIGFLSDCKHALRLYARTPVASFIAIAILAIGMGSVTLFLSLYVNLLLTPHPGFEKPRELVTFGPGNASDIGTMSKEIIDRIANDVLSLESAAGIGRTQIQIDDEPMQSIVELVTPEFFPGLRPKLALGRGFTAADYATEAERVAVISHAYWQARFSGSPDVLGTTLTIARPERPEPVPGPGGGVFAPAGPQAEADEPGAIEVRIVGVMSPDYEGFASSAFGGFVAMWLPDEHGFALVSSSQVDGRRWVQFSGVGRRSAGASAAAVATELTGRYGAAVDPSGGQSVRNFHAVDGVVPSLSLVRELGRALRMMLGASVLLALVAAANVALFLLARAPGRRRELAIRLSVGAPLKRLARQLVTEAGAFVAVAGALALALAMWLAALLRTPMQSLAIISINWQVLAVLAASLVLLTTLVSLSPVLGLRQIGIGSGSRQVTARATLAQQIAGTVQVTVAGALSAAGLAFAWQVGTLLYGDPGYATENLHFARFQQVRFTAGPDGTRIAASVQLASGFIESERRHAAIASLPGIDAVSIASAVPGQSSFNMRSVQSQIDPTQRVQVRLVSIDSRFAAMLGLRVVDGRTPGPDEPGVALVNRALARAIFGRDEVAGESLSSLPGQASTPIVGVVEDLSFGHPAQEAEPMAFVTAMAGQSGAFSALIKSTSTSAQLDRQLRDLAQSGAIEVPPAYVRPLATLRKNTLGGDIARAVLTMIGALLVVLLAVAGFYGTQRYLVTAGRREYAIRASLGAGPKALGRLVMGRGLSLGLPGLVVGTLTAFATVAWLRDNYIPREISALAIAAVVAVAIVLLLLLASFSPARFARRTQPAPLLRDD